MESFDNIYVVIPAFNEGAVLQKTISELKRKFKNVIVVDDGSDDKTREIMENSGVIPIHHPINMGQGASINSGFNFVKNIKSVEAVITFDADGQHASEDAIAFAKEIKNCSEEVILGSRFLKHEKNIPFMKRFALKFVIKITNIILGMKLTDTHNGLKAIKIDAIKKIDIKIDNYAFESEMLTQISKLNMSYKELPTDIIYTNYSKKKGQSLRNGLRVIESLILLFFNK